MNEIYKKIKELADQLKANGMTYTRADIAAELKKLGVSDDTIEVSKIVWQAYKYFADDSNIGETMVGNNGKSTIVEEYRLQDSLSQNDNSRAIAIAKENGVATTNALDALDSSVRSLLAQKAGEVASSTIDIVTGTSAVKSVRSEASGLYEGYAKMVDAYNDAKDFVVANVKDFTSLRTAIGQTYREYASQLIDVYGDAIKAVSPELFDFDKIEWMDVQAMQQNIKLEFDKVSDKCHVLIGEISDSFANSFRNAISDVKISGSNKGLGLALAGLKMLNHYVATAEKAAKLKADMVTLRTDVKHDATLINGDIERLAVIHKNINDLFIPMANAFFNHAKEAMNPEVKALMDAVYSNPDIAKLKEERSSLMARLAELENKANDHRRNIEMYSSMLSTEHVSEESKKEAYATAKGKKPKKPSALGNLISFGSKGKDYEREAYEWEEVCAPLVTEYEDLLVDIKLNQDELEAHTRGLEETLKEMESLRKELAAVGQKMKAALNAAPEVQAEMLKHLRPIVEVLRLGREIMESKIDERLTHTVNIGDGRDLASRLPADLETNLHAFGETIRQNMRAEASDKTPEAVAKSSNDFLSESVTLLDAAAHLHLLMEQETISKEMYDHELAKLQGEFRKDIAAIGEKAEALRKVLKEVNTAADAESLRKSLLRLCDGKDFGVSDADLEAFARGEKEIRL